MLFTEKRSEALGLKEEALALSLSLTEMDHGKASHVVEEAIEHTIEAKLVKELDEKLPDVLVIIHKLSVPKEFDTNLKDNLQNSVVRIMKLKDIDASSPPLMNALPTLPTTALDKYLAFSIATGLNIQSLAVLTSGLQDNLADTIERALR